MDIFVSYAHVDNQLLSDSTKKGWITHFVNKLRTLTNGKMGREEDYTLWKDFRLQGNDAITPEIEEQLNSTQSFILFLSPGWIASDWCQKELKIFCQVHQNDIQQRIFVVELDSLQPDEKPDVVRDLKGYRFWWKNDEDKTRRLGFPVPQDTDTDYYDCLVDLSNDIAKILKEKQSTEAEQIIPKATIYVAPVNDPLYRQRESLISELNQYRIAVLPRNNTFNSDIKKDLTECSHFVQLLDGNWVMGIPQQQYQTAQKAGKPVLQWRDPKLDFSGNDIRSEQETLLQGKTVIAATLPDFIRMVREMVLPSPKSPEEEIPASNTGKKTIFETFAK